MFHHHVVRIVNVETRVVLLHVLVYLIISAAHPIANLNVPSIQNVQVTRLVCERNVEIPVQDHVVLELNVQL